MNRFTSVAYVVESSVMLNREDTDLQMQIWGLFAKKKHVCFRVPCLGSMKSASRVLEHSDGGSGPSTWETGVHLISRSGTRKKSS